MRQYFYCGCGSCEYRYWVDTAQSNPDRNYWDHFDSDDAYWGNGWSEDDDLDRTPGNPVPEWEEI